MSRLRERLAGLLGGRVLANAGWLYLDQVVRAVVVLVAFGAVARHLGPEQFGVLSFAVAFAGLFVPLAMVGLDYVLVMELVRERSAEAKVLATGGRLKVLAALAAFALAAVATLAVPAGHPARPLLLLTAVSLLGQPFLLFDFWFQSHVAAKYSVAARLVACLLVNGLRLAFVFQGAPVSGFAWLFSLEAVVFGLGLVAAYRLAGGPAILAWWRAYDGTMARRLWGQAWPLFLADIAIVGYLRLDQLLLSHLAGAGQLGHYAAAYRLADAAEFFALALVNSWFPQLVTLHGRGRQEFEAGLVRFLTRITWFAIAVAAGLSLAAPWVTRLVLGAEFGGAAGVLAWLTWANVFVTVIAVRGKWFLLDGLQSYSLAFFAAGAALHLGGVCWLAPRWGATGAAVSFLGAQAAMVLLLPLVPARTRPAAFLALRSLWPRRT